MVEFVPMCSTPPNPVLVTCVELVTGPWSVKLVPKEMVFVIMKTALDPTMVNGPDNAALGATARSSRPVRKMEEAVKTVLEACKRKTALLLTRTGPKLLVPRDCGCVTVSKALLTRRLPVIALLARRKT